MNTIPRLTLFTLLGTLCLAGCAHKPPAPPKTQETFITLIKRDGTKQFSYTLIMEMHDGKGKSGASHGGHHGGPPGGGMGPDGKGPGKHRQDKSDGMEDQFTLMFDNGLNEKLATTGFCRTGFSQLDKQSRYGATQLQGECNEPATDDDRQKFPNPPPKKVKVDVLE